MNGRFAIGTIALAVAGAASGGTTPSYLPLAAGNTWHLADAETGAVSTVGIHVRGKSLALRGFPGLPERRVRANGAAVEAWDDASDRWEPFLRLGAPAGTRYSVDLSDTLLWRRVAVSVASRALTIEDGRGRELAGCVRLTFRYGKQTADAGLEELVFAPGVGLVRVVEMTIAGPRERLLMSYRLR